MQRSTKIIAAVVFSVSVITGQLLLGRIKITLQRRVLILWCVMSVMS